MRTAADGYFPYLLGISWVSWTCADCYGQELGGEGGIRTRVTLSRKHAFQACDLNRSSTSPEGREYYLIQPGAATAGAMDESPCGGRTSARRWRACRRVSATTQPAAKTCLARSTPVRWTADCCR